MFCQCQPRTSLRWTVGTRSTQVWHPAPQLEARQGPVAQACPQVPQVLTQVCPTFVFSAQQQQQQRLGVFGHIFALSKSLIKVLLDKHIEISIFELSRYSLKYSSLNIKVLWMSMKLKENEMKFIYAIDLDFLTTKLTKKRPEYLTPICCGWMIGW